MCTNKDGVQVSWFRGDLITKSINFYSLISSPNNRKLDLKLEVSSLTPFSSSNTSLMNVTNTKLD